MGPAVGCLIEGILKKRLVFSKKSVLLASSPALAAMMSAVAAAHGLTIKVDVVGKDLGVGVYSGGRRRLPVLRKRMDAAARRLRKARQLHHKDAKHAQQANHTKLAKQPKHTDHAKHPKHSKQAKQGQTLTDGSGGRTVTGN